MYNEGRKVTYTHSMIVSFDRRRQHERSGLLSTSVTIFWRDELSERYFCALNMSNKKLPATWLTSARVGKDHHIDNYAG